MSRRLLAGVIALACAGLLLFSDPALFRETAVVVAE